MCVAIKIPLVMFTVIFQRYRLKDTGFFSVVMDPWHTGMFVAVTRHNYGVTVHRVFQNITQHPKIQSPELIVATELTDIILALLFMSWLMLL